MLDSNILFAVSQTGLLHVCMFMAVTLLGVLSLQESPQTNSIYGTPWIHS